MSQAICITFPRSGHHLLVSLLANYYNNETIKTKMVSPLEPMSYLDMDRFKYCEFYNHCQMMPCSIDATNFQKNHDFGLILPKKNNENYCVQIRNPFSCILSYYKLEHENTTEESWLKFLIDKLQYWNEFMDKWVDNKDYGSFAIIPYEFLIDDTFDIVSRVIHFLNIDDKINSALLHRVIRNSNIRINRTPINNERFDYYFDNILSESEKRYSEILKRLGNDNSF